MPPSRVTVIPSARVAPASVDGGGHLTRTHSRTTPRAPRSEGRDVRRAWATVPRGTDVDVWILHVQYQRTRSRQLLAGLVEEYQTYATSIAHRLVRHGEPEEDIAQVAMEGLVSSLQRFDVDRGLPFPAFARPTISGAIKRHYRDRGWSIRTPRSVHDIAGSLRDTEERLTAEMGRSPQRAEVARAIGVDVTTVSRAQQAIRSRAATSLDQPGPDGGPPRAEMLGALDPDLTRADDHVALRGALAQLSERERAMLKHYYVEEMSQREIGACFGVSQMQISRLLTGTIARLRRTMGDDAA